MEKDQSTFSSHLNRRDLIKAGIILAVATGAGLGIYELEQNGKYHPNHPEESEYIKSLLHSESEEVRGVGDLDKRSGDRNLFSGIMQFFNVSESDAKSWQADALEQTIKAKLTPLSIFDVDGLNLAKPESERPLVHRYFETIFGELRSKGIKPEQTGIVVVCPEFVSGFHGQPEDYAANLNMFLEETDQTSTGVTTSNMISLPEADKLLPTLSGVRHDLLQNVGIQALYNKTKLEFDSKGKPDMSKFFPVAKIKEIVDLLGNKPIWINTSIVRSDSTVPTGEVSYSLDQRVAIAEAIADNIAKIQKSGVDVTTVNLFAENKLNGRYPSLNSEGRDFSFHPGDEPIVIAFAKRMRRLGIKLSAYALPNDIVRK